MDYPRAQKTSLIPLTFVVDGMFIEMMQVNF